jgi:glycosyltransferase involved in cell wall biosynthesis
MKIVIVQGAFLPIPPLLGGAVEKMWYNLAKEFANQGHHVVYISKTFNNQSKDELLDKIQHYRVKGYTIKSNLIILKLLDLFYSIRAKKIIPKNCDIIVSNTFWLPIILNENQKSKCIIDIARMPKGQLKLYSKKLIFRVNSTSVLNAVKKEINYKYWNKIVLIPNPLPFSEPYCFNQDSKKNIILYTGRINIEKGIDILIKSFLMLRNIDNWKLVIIGPYLVNCGGSGIKYLNYLKDIDHNNKNIIFKDPINDVNILYKYYHESSIFVYPSIAEKGETFGVSPLEAMSFGCSTIVSDLDCFKDFIQNNNNGFIFNHRSKFSINELSILIQNVINDLSLRKLISQNAVNVRNSHNNIIIANQFLDLFEKNIKF